ncbi:hypothetical protein HDV00_000483 [Rhizophlyctis rosea]|nr:hypothetical protein HDV00_000483 [Rhizophlyctis rosea]
MRLVKRNDILEVLGVNLMPFLATAENEGTNWVLEEEEGFKQSEAFRSHYQDLKTYYSADSEPMTRAYLDAYILEVMRTLQRTTNEHLKIYGEIAISCTANGKTLNGYGDWFIAYGEKGDALLKNVALVGVAKDITVDITSEQALCQVFAYMLIIHRIRKEEGKAHSRVYGFITNRRRWLFLMVTDSGTLKKTTDLKESEQQSQILANLCYIFQQAQLASPSTTLSTSTESLTEESANTESLVYGDLEVVSFHNSMGAAFTLQDEEEDEEEDDDEDKEGEWEEEGGEEGV